MSLPSILFAGDPHGDFRPIVRAALRTRPQGVVLLGDFDLERPLDIEMAEVVAAGIQIFWIPGNHDTDKQAWFDHAFNSRLASKNLHGRVAVVGDFVIAGLGGVFRRSAWGGEEKTAPGVPRKFDRRMELKHRSSVFPHDYERIASLRRVDILVSHEAPAATQENGSEALDRLIARVRPRFAIHGHHHRDYRAQMGDTIVIGVGKSGVADLEKTLVPGAGQRQEQRMRP
jgi:Icc-related predicted phosphoesterase